MRYELRVFLIYFLAIILLTGCIQMNNDTLHENTGEDKNPNNQEASKTMTPESFYIKSYSIEKLNVENIDIDDFRLSRNMVYNNRIELMEKVKDNSIVVLFSDYVVNDKKYSYTPNRNFYYFTGIDRENFIVLITKEDNQVNEYLFALNVPQVDKWTGRMLTLDESVYYSGTTNILRPELFKSFFASQLDHRDIDHVYVDIGDFEINQVIEKSTDSNSFLTRGEDFALDVYESYKDKEILSIGQIASKLRSIKSSEELEKIEKAIWITGEGIKEIMRNAKPGMMEYELEACFDYRINSLGATEHAFPTIAASGENANILHYRHNDQRIGEEELILFDLGAAYGYYSSDISRTIPVNGKFTERQKEIYNIVLKTQLETMEAVKPGITLRDLNSIAREKLTAELIDIGLINNVSEISRYYPHSVSHSLGLDTHDPISYSEPLKPGMVITIEPGLYIEEEGIGIRIEDNVLVTEDGYINLSEHIIKTVEEIESFMESN